METTKPQYTILIANNDKGALIDEQHVNYGNDLIEYFKLTSSDTTAIPLKIKEVTDKTVGTINLKNKKADALIIIDDSFSQSILKRKAADTTSVVNIEFIGDLSNTNYLISAVWANEIVNEFALTATNNKRIVHLKEMALGNSGTASSFDMFVPGILIVSLIMLMFTASIAFVSEVENKTITRLKLSKLRVIDFLTGISTVQLLVGIVSVLLTLLTAILLGFKYEGSLLMMIFVAGLTSLSIIAFSLIIAAITKTANEVLVVGNFPMFLFMFFTGAAFPLKSDALFTIAGYPVNIQGLMTPTHAISALNKTLIMNMEFSSIIPEIISIVVLTSIYFIIGGMMFKQRHLKLT